MRYAYAAGSRALKGLVVSPDPAVRDDLARVLRAVDPGSIVVAGAANQLNSAQIEKSLGGKAQPDIAIIHDSDRQRDRRRAQSCLFFLPAAGIFRSSPRCRSVRLTTAPILVR